MRFEPRIIPLEAICPTVEELLAFVDYACIEVCPNPLCHHGMMPDLTEFDEVLEGLGTVIAVQAVECPVCWGEGRVYAFYPN